MCGEAGVSALRFHLCNLLSIVQDYYQLFNNSGDIYQGQLCRAVSCRENGLSVILLHSQAGNERLFNWGQEPLAAGTWERRHFRSQCLIRMHSFTFQAHFSVQTRSTSVFTVPAGQCDHRATPAEIEGSHRSSTGLH